jgi:hypothetical protein
VHGERPTIRIPQSSEGPRIEVTSCCDHAKQRLLAAVQTKVKRKDGSAAVTIDSAMERS